MALLLPFRFGALLLAVTIVVQLLASRADALKFDLHLGTKDRCIRNFVNKDTLVVVTTTIDGHRGDGQVVNMHVRFWSLIQCFAREFTADQSFWKEKFLLGPMGSSSH